MSIDSNVYTVPMQKYAIIEKDVGETPLQAIEKFRLAELGADDLSPLAYAGRLDPMASGKLLVLIGDECKNQTEYHGLDKSYLFSVLFGVSSDTQDVLGRLTLGKPTHPEKKDLDNIAKSLQGKISLPYPHFSSKTVAGKPLHVWTLEDRLDEIEIPVKDSLVYQLKCLNIETKTTEDIYKETISKIESIPTVTEASKALGADFRRVDVKADWQLWKEMFPKVEWSIATFECTTSSGTYMRSLAELIGKKIGTDALAYSIHRTEIGHYQPLPLLKGFWRKKF